MAENREKFFEKIQKILLKKTYVFLIVKTAGFPGFTNVNFLQNFKPYHANPGFFNFFMRFFMLF